MLQHPRRPRLRGLVCSGDPSADLPIGLPVLVNAPIFGLGHGQRPAAEGEGGPINGSSEAIVPSVWVGLHALATGRQFQNARRRAVDEAGPSSPDISGGQSGGAYLAASTSGSKVCSTFLTSPKICASVPSIERRTQKPPAVLARYQSSEWTVA